MELRRTRHGRRVGRPSTITEGLNFECMCRVEEDYQGVIRLLDALEYVVTQQKFRSGGRLGSGRRCGAQHSRCPRPRRLRRGGCPALRGSCRDRIFDGGAPPAEGQACKCSLAATVLVWYPGYARHRQPLQQRSSRRYSGAVCPPAAHDVRTGRPVSERLVNPQITPRCCICSTMRGSRASRCCGFLT